MESISVAFGRTYFLIIILKETTFLALNKCFAVMFETFSFEANLLSSKVDKHDYPGDSRPNTPESLSNLFTEELYQPLKTLHN